MRCAVAGLSAGFLQLSRAPLLAVGDALTQGARATCSVHSQGQQTFSCDCSAAHRRTACIVRRASRSQGVCSGSKCRQYVDVSGFHCRPVPLLTHVHLLQGPLRMSRMLLLFHVPFHALHIPQVVQGCGGLGAGGPEICLSHWLSKNQPLPTIIATTPWPQHHRCRAMRMESLQLSQLQCHMCIVHKMHCAPA
jgi:hypothetical protein